MTPPPGFPPRVTQGHSQRQSGKPVKANCISLDVLAGRGR